MLLLYDPKPLGKLKANLLPPYAVFPQQKFVSFMYFILTVAFALL